MRFRAPAGGQRRREQHIHAAAEMALGHFFFWCCCCCRERLLPLPRFRAVFVKRSCTPSEIVFFVFLSSGDLFLFLLGPIHLIKLFRVVSFTFFYQKKIERKGGGRRDIVCCSLRFTAYRWGSGRCCVFYSCLCLSVRRGVCFLAMLHLHAIDLPRPPICGVHGIEKSGRCSSKNPSSLFPEQWMDGRFRRLLEFLIAYLSIT